MREFPTPASRMLAHRAWLSAGMWWITSDQARTSVQIPQIAGPPSLEFRSNFLHVVARDNVDIAPTNVDAGDRAWRSVIPSTTRFAVGGRPMSQPRDDRQDDLFRPPLEEIINLRHPLVRLAGGIDWDFLAGRFSLVWRGGPGRPRVPARAVGGGVSLQ